MSSHWRVGGSRRGVVRWLESEDEKLGYYYYTLGLVTGIEHPIVVRTMEIATFWVGHIMEEKSIFDAGLYPGIVWDSTMGGCDASSIRDRRWIYVEDSSWIKLEDIMQVSQANGVGCNWMRWSG
eukprot:5252684-Ditylum_brightwellii.AAC.1